MENNILKSTAFQVFKIGFTLLRVSPIFSNTHSLRRRPQCVKNICYITESSFQVMEPDKIVRDA